MAQRQWTKEREVVGEQEEENWRRRTRRGKGSEQETVFAMVVSYSNIEV